MKRFGAWARALLLGAALGSACDGGPGTSGAEGGADRPGGGDSDGPAAQAPVCLWDTRAPELKLPDDRVKGALRGSSRNASTTCTRQKETGGPEAIYLLRLPERMVVDIEVVSAIDTVLAIRRVCDDPRTELACDDGAANASAPEPEPDAGASPIPADAGPPSAAGRDAHLHASLEAGAYFLVVDEGEPFGVGGAFELKVHARRPPAETICAEAPLLSDGWQVHPQDLNMASVPSPCGDAEARPALFYRAVIPSGQRLTAHAILIEGYGGWTPTLQVFTGCGASGADVGANHCLASDRTDADGQKVLHHVNDGPTEQPVMLAVSSSAAADQGRYFYLHVSISEPLENLTCATARPLSDGQLLRDQDLSQGSVESSPCKSPGQPSLFYSATLQPRQSVRVVAEGDSGGRVVFFGREGCSSLGCNDYSDRPGELTLVNREGTTKTVLIEATTYDPSPKPRFDLRVMMPPPPDSIYVRAAPGLTTSEAGGQATFEVQWTSPVTEPVDIPLASSHPGEGTASPASLRFTAENWQMPRTVTVTGVDDSARDGHRSYGVTIGPSISQDSRYHGVSAAPVALVNRDDEPGFSFEGPALLLTSESGAGSSFKVVLNRAPSATVRLPLDSSDAGEGKVSPSELVFEPGAWNLPQTVTVSGIDDGERDGSQGYQVLTGAAVSEDAAYSGIDPPDLPVRNADNDYERVAAQVISGNLRCSNTFRPYRLAADQGGSLYAVMSCDGVRASAPDAGGSFADAGFEHPRAFVAVSADGGRTFGAPVDIGVAADNVAVMAGRPGVAVVAATGPDGFSVVRTEDAGATWQRYGLGKVGVHNITVASAGDRMLISSPLGPSERTWWLSEDAGRTFQSFRPALPDYLMGQGMDSDGTVWIVSYESTPSGVTLTFRTSHDGGRTFDAGVHLPGEPYLSFFAAGPKLILGVGQDVLSLPRDGSGTARIVPGPPDSYTFARVLVADEKDNLVVVSSDRLGAIELHRLNAGASAFESPRTSPHSEVRPSAIPLSDTATAILFSGGGQVAVAVETWP
jgi:hypothetical protein